MSSEDLVASPLNLFLKLVLILFIQLNPLSIPAFAVGKVAYISTKFVIASNPWLKKFFCQERLIGITFPFF